VISLLALTYDLRTFSEAIKLPNSREESPGSRTQNDLPDGVATGRDMRDVGSTSFEDNVFPVQVDLTEWTRKFEQKFEDFTKLVELRFKGLEEKFDAMDRRQNATEKRFVEVKERIDQFESRLNDSKTETEAQMKELKDRCSRPTEMPDTSISLSTVTPPSVDWILIQKHNFLDKNAFKHKLWEDYKHEFGDRVNEYWLGLQRMHDLTKNGNWYLKIAVKYDLDKYDNPSSRRGETALGVWESFSVASEEEKFQLNIGNLIEKANIGTVDPMYWSNGMKFTAEDRDNDDRSSENCAVQWGGGWWHNDCFYFCGTCQRDLREVWYDGISNEKLSESSMWIKQEINN